MWRQSGHDPGDAVVGRYAVPVGQELAQPRELGVTELLDGFPSFGTTDHGTNTQQENLIELIALVLLRSRILDNREVGHKISAHTSSSSIRTGGMLRNSLSLIYLSFGCPGCP